MSKTTFTRSVFVSGTFDLFDKKFNVMCEQHHRTTFNPFLNGKKNSVKNVTCKPGFRDRFVNKVVFAFALAQSKCSLSHRSSRCRFHVRSHSSVNKPSRDSHWRLLSKYLRLLIHARVCQIKRKNSFQSDRQGGCCRIALRVKSWTIYMTLWKHVFIHKGILVGVQHVSTLNLYDAILSC